LADDLDAVGGHFVADRGVDAGFFEDGTGHGSIIARRRNRGPSPISKKRAGPRGSALGEERRRRYLLRVRRSRQRAARAAAQAAGRAGGLVLDGARFVARLRRAVARF